MRAVVGRNGLLAAMAALATAFAVSMMFSATAANGQQVKVLVCHATGSQSNPFNAIVVDDDSTQLEGHLGHEGDFVSDVENPEQLSDEEAEAICDAGPTTTTTGTDTTTTTTGTDTTTTTAGDTPTTGGGGDKDKVCVLRKNKGNDRNNGEHKDNDDNGEHKDDDDN